MKVKIDLEISNLEIKEKNLDWFNRVDENSTVIVYIPEDSLLDNLEISTGVGIDNIQGVKTIKLDIEAGAGKVTLNNIVAQKADIDGGVGKVEITTK